MTTDTDFHLIGKLKDQYAPAMRGIVSATEKDLITATLELDARTDIELQNVRDMTAMLYGQQAAQEKDPAAALGLMDAMSGICAIIDQEKIRRGLPV